jgi:hypothetical protein
VEAMSKFKLGSKVKVIEITLAYNGGLKVGDIAAIQEFQSSHNRFVRLIGDDSNACSWHDVNNIELVEPKWTIYNNTLPWSDLSDKQKGKLLLAKLNGIALCIVVKSLQGGDTFIDNIGIIHSRGQCVYRAQLEPVKPEPTTAELFFTDWHETDVHLVKEFSEYMIGKGWVKK